MTLHWWMHWFWVTLLFTILANTRENHAAPQSETDTERQSRALYLPKIQQTTTKASPTTVDDKTNTTVAASIQIHWTLINVSESNVTSAPSAVNVTERETVAQNTKYAEMRNLTRSDFVKEEILEGAAESRIVTEKPLSLETTYLQTRIPPNVESSRRVIDEERGMDTGVIAGISFAVLVVAALTGSTVFVLYRRRYLNKPQTLNDKCSNPDSSGYLDDSTIRDNSEEMYSLDNDSFLNSLEAMTIQNYWTDTVKHTKL